MREGDTRVDVAIVGGGPAGATLAAVLTARGLRVLVVDAGQRAGPPAEVLPPTAVPVLDALGLLGELEAGPDWACACFGVVKRWGSTEDRHEYLADRGGRGWIVERRGFDERLQQRARRAGAAWFERTRLEGLAQRGGAWRLALNGPRGWTSAGARFLVDASGRARAVVRRIGVVTERTSALVATWPAPNARALHGRANWLHVVAGSAGWSYSLVDARGETREVALSLGPARARGRDARHVSACSQLISSRVGDGWAAVGDAAVAFDPITSQGLCNALASALALSPAIEAALTSPRRAEESLREYGDAVARTFRHAEGGAREIYRAALHSFGGSFWERMSAATPSDRVVAPRFASGDGRSPQFGNW